MCDYYGGDFTRDKIDYTALPPQAVNNQLLLITTEQLSGDMMERN